MQLEQWQLEDTFDEWLDNEHEAVELLGLTYPISELLRAADPIAYDKAFNKWLDDYNTDDYYGSEESEEELC